METSRLGLSDLRDERPGDHPGNAGARQPRQTPTDVHTILHARTPQAARQIQQLTSSLRDCNRAVNSVDALSRELQDITTEQEDEIRRLRSQSERSESRRRKDHTSHSVRFQHPPPASGGTGPESGHAHSVPRQPVQTLGLASSEASEMNSLPGLLGQTLRQQDELLRELRGQGQQLRHLSEDRYASTRHQPDPVATSRIHHQLDSLRGDIQRLEHSRSGGGAAAAAASTGADLHLSDLRHQVNHLDSKHHQAVSELHRSLGNLQQQPGQQHGILQHEIVRLREEMKTDRDRSYQSQQQQALSELQHTVSNLQRPSQQDVLLQEIGRLREDIRSGPGTGAAAQHHTALDATERLSSRLDKMDTSMREQRERDKLLDRLEQLQSHVNRQEEQRNSTLTQVTQVQQQFVDMERQRDRLALQVDALKVEIQKQEALRTVRDEQGIAAALRESERTSAELLARLQHSEAAGTKLRNSNDRLQGDVLRMTSSSRSSAESSSRERDRALQLSQKYKGRYQAEVERKAILQRQLDSVQDRLASLESQHQNDQAVLSQQANDLKLLQEQLRLAKEQHEADVLHLQAELTTAEARFSTTEEDRLDLEKELERIRVESQETIRHYQTHHGRSSSLTEKLTAKLTRLRDREKELHQLVKTNSHREGVIREELEHVKKSNSELQKQHRSHVESLASQLRQQQDSAEQRIKEMSQRQQQQLQDMTATIGKQKSSLQANAVKLEELGAEKQIATGDGIRVQRRCAELEKEVDACKHKLAQQRESYKDKISQLKSMCITSDGRGLDDLVSQLSASRHINEQVLMDQETILRAVAGEVDSLIDQVTEHSSLPKPILPDTSGLETDARKWISAILGKLTWLQRELRLKEDRGRARAASDLNKFE